MRYEGTAKGRDACYVGSPTRLSAVGFSDIKLYGDLGGGDYGFDAERLIAVARKPTGMCVDRAELKQLHAALPRRRHDALMVTGTLGSGEASEPVGDHPQWPHQRLGHELRHRLAREGPQAQALQNSLAIIGGLRRGDEGLLVLRAASGLAGRTLAAEIGIVDFDTARNPMYKLSSR